MWVAFANAKATHIFFSKNIRVYAIFNESCNDMLTNDIISFEQLGPDETFPMHWMNLCILRKLKDNFSLGTVHIIMVSRLDKAYCKYTMFTL